MNYPHISMKVGKYVHFLLIFMLRSYPCPSSDTSNDAECIGWVRAMVADGLKCVPETGPGIRIKAAGIAPVGIVLPSRAIATLPPARFSAMMPEPTTVVRRSRLPITSAESLRVMGYLHRQAKTASVRSLDRGFAAASACIWFIA